MESCFVVSASSSSGSWSHDVKERRREAWQGEGCLSVPASVPRVQPWEP